MSAIALFGEADSSTIHKDAVLSPCGTYRYKLTRHWGDEHALPFVCLNPSTADAEIDDPTIRRCMGFARREGAGGIVVANLYALRTAHPKMLMRHPNPYGPDNPSHLAYLGTWSSEHNIPIVCGWGAHPAAKPNLVVEVLRFLTASGAKTVCLGRTGNGSPRHPLYVRADQPLEPFP